MIPQKPEAEPGHIIRTIPFGDVPPLTFIVRRMRDDGAIIAHPLDDHLEMGYELDHLIRADEMDLSDREPQPLVVKSQLFTTLCESLIERRVGQFHVDRFPRVLDGVRSTMGDDLLLFHGFCRPAGSPVPDHRDQSDLRLVHLHDLLDQTRVLSREAIIRLGLDWWV